MILATSIAEKWFWGLVAMFFVVLSIGLALALIVVTRQRDGLLNTPTSVNTASKFMEDMKPNVCGSVNTNKNTISLTELNNPGPFQALTTDEIKKLRHYLEKSSEMKASKAGSLTLSSSTIFAIDLLLPKKSEVLGFLKKTDASALPRFARVTMLRGDKNPPVVEEWKCGPLHQISSCNVLSRNETSTKNPVDFSIRPLTALDFDKNGAFKYLLNKLEQELGSILLESYNNSFLSCSSPENCLVLGISPITSNVVDYKFERYIWVFPLYNITYPTMHSLGMSILCTMSGIDPSTWTFTKIWYSGQMFSSATDFKNNYIGNRITKIKMIKPMQNDTSRYFKWNVQTGTPQRAPTIVESDGNRYLLKNGQVTYLNWAFNFLMSSITGPAIYNVKFKGERIAYEIALNEMASYYPGDQQWKRATNYPNNGRMTNKVFMSLVPGTDCPDTATIVTQPTLNLYGELLDSVAFCLFEQNDGIPLRRHLAYTVLEGGFYGGMEDYAFILRSLVEVSNYDYIVDFIFHQNGALQTRITPKAGEGFLETWHHHLINFKVDLDIAGTSNVYQTWVIQSDEVSYQNKLVRTTKTTELDALDLLYFDKPKQHIVFNNSTKNAFGENRGYSIQLGDTSAMLVNVELMPWAQHPIVVTKHKDSEIRSSSIYGMFDKANPTVSLRDFYQDNDTIVNEDLVFWITSGAVQIPSSESKPFANTVGTKMGFTLSPFNYYSECPSMSSRDALNVQHKDPADHSKGVTVNRNGNSNTQCLTSQPSLDFSYV